MPKKINSFPAGVRNTNTKEDANPAVQLFGRRFFADQPTLEILSEFFLLMTSRKIIGEEAIVSFLPPIELLHKWPTFNPELKYQPKAKLNLKLFAFLGSSRLETRHETHRKHCEKLWDLLKDKIDSEDMEHEEILRVLSNLFFGFWGNGAQRTWCAQTFLPFCEGVLATETIWNESEARRDVNAVCWEYVIDHFNDFFSVNKHRFLARSGEMLYLQVCNALRQDTAKIQNWISKHTINGMGLGLTKEESNPIDLHAALQNALIKFFKLTPPTLNKLADFIDTGVESESAESSDSNSDSPRTAECGWCAEDSWREGYLFAVELKRILSADINILETIELLEIACAMQVMRSLAAQSYRFTSDNPDREGFDYRVLISDSSGINRRIKELSRSSLNKVCREIHSAIRIPEIKDTLDTNNISKIYKEADDRYGHKLYLRIGKSIGLIVPRRGAGTRFVLTDKILRYLVLSLVPKKRMTLDTLKHQIELHHGWVFEESGLREARNWQEQHTLLDSSEHADAHLEQMLDASGVLVKLSDSCSLVKNPYCTEVAL